MAFDPNEHTIQLKSKDGEKDYLPVQWRLAWINDKCKLFKITILHRIIDLDHEVTKDMPQWDEALRRSIKKPKTVKGFAYFEVRVEDEDGKVGEDVGSETAIDFDDYIEKAKTKATGRALALIGYGTQHAPELNEMPRIVDAPVDPQSQSDPPPPSTPKPKSQEKTEKKETAVPVTQSKPTPALAKPKAITALPASTDLIEATRCLLEDAGPYEQQHIFKLAQITEANQEKPHLWTTEQCDTITTWFDGLSKQHENWLAQTRLQTQHDEVMKQAKDTFGNDAVTALKNTIPGVNGKKLSELTAGQADLLIIKLRNGELVDGQIVDKTETIAITGTGNAAA